MVGWTGVAMLVMSLSGIYLWWPRNVPFGRGLRCRRGPATSYNLHHLFGFWIAIPLAVVSATGIYLGFPQQGRELLASVAPMTPSQRGGRDASLLASPQLDADRAMAAALAGMAGARAFGDLPADPGHRRMARPGARRGRRCHCAGRRSQWNAQHGDAIIR